MGFSHKYQLLCFSADLSLECNSSATFKPPNFGFTDMIK